MLESGDPDLNLALLTIIIFLLGRKPFIPMSNGCRMQFFGIFMKVSVGTGTGQ